MKDQDKTKEQLINELAEMRQRIAELQAADIERKRAEEELQRLYEQAQRDTQTKTVLLQEVNHRVKNNLTAILGFLFAEQRFAKTEDQPVYRAIIQNLMNRIGGMAAVHSLLSASEWAPVPLANLAGKVIRSAMQLRPRHKQIFIDVPPSPILVTPRQANGLAIVITELTTNTIKHALAERQAVRISVRIALEDDTIVFEFRDDGPGYPEDVSRLERHSAGLYLIQAAVHDLSGELELCNDQGAVTTVRFKREAAAVEGE